MLGLKQASFQLMTFFLLLLGTWAQESKMNCLTYCLGSLLNIRRWKDCGVFCRELKDWVRLWCISFMTCLDAHAGEVIACSCPQNVSFCCLNFSNRYLAGAVLWTWHGTWTSKQGLKFWERSWYEITSPLIPFISVLDQDGFAPFAIICLKNHLLSFSDLWFICSVS